MALRVEILGFGLGFGNEDCRVRVTILPLGGHPKSWVELLILGVWISRFRLNSLF